MKKLRKEVEQCIDNVDGNFISLMDLLYCNAFNVTISEIEQICEQATDDELNIIVIGLGTLNSSSTYNEKRRALEIRNKYVEYYQTK